MTQQAVIDKNLETLLNHLVQLNAQLAEAHKQGGAPLNMRPPTTEWSGALSTDNDIRSISKAFNSDQAQEALIRTFTPATVGNTGDGIALSLQIDYAAQAERAFRARHTQGFTRSIAHVVGRETGHGGTNSVFSNQVLRYITTIISQSAES